MHTSIFWEALQHVPQAYLVSGDYSSHKLAVLSSQRAWPVGHQFIWPHHFSEAVCPEAKFRNEDFSHRSFLCSPSWQRQWGRKRLNWSGKERLYSTGLVRPWEKVGRLSKSFDYWDVAFFPNFYFNPICGLRNKSSKC